MADEKLVAKISADSTQLKGELDSATEKVKKFKDVAKETTDKGAEDWRKLGGAILHAGSSVAIIAKGVESLVRIFKELSQAATDAVLKMAKLNAGNQAETSQANYQRAADAQDALRKYYDLALKAQNSPSSELEEQRYQAEKDFQRRFGQYGIDLGAEDLKGEISRGLEVAQKERIKAINAEIDAYNKANDALDKRLNNLNWLNEGEAEALQTQKNANAERLRQLSQLKRETEAQRPDRDFRAMAGAKEFDAEQKALEDAQKQRLMELDNQRKQVINAQKVYVTALNQYSNAIRTEREAARELADAKRRVAREQRMDALEQRRERLQRQLSRFAFAPFEGFEVAESGQTRAARRRTYRLDASIAEKMARQETGERVFYSNSERRRIAEYQSLAGKDRAAEASQKQMQAADKQRDAAESLQRAASAFREATAGRRANAQSYAAALTLLHNDLVKLYTDTYRVK